MAPQTKTQTQIQTQTSLIALYENDLTERGLVKPAIRQYLRAVRETAELLAGEDRLLAATEEDLRRAAVERMARKKSVGMENWYSGTRNFYKFLVRLGLREDNPMCAGFLKQFFGTIGETREPRITKYTDSAPDFNRLRDRAILSLIQSTDVQLTELQIMTVGCCKLKHGYLRLQKRRVLLTENTKDVLGKYINTRLLSMPGSVTDQSLLFIDAHNGSALPAGEYWNLIRRSLRG